MNKELYDLLLNIIDSIDDLQKYPRTTEYCDQSYEVRDMLKQLEKLNEKKTNGEN